MGSINLFWQLPGELLELWHEHRTSIIYSAIVFLTVARLWLHYRYPREKASLSSTPGSPDLYAKKWSIGIDREKDLTVDVPLLNGVIGKNIAAKTPKSIRKASPKRVVGKKSARASKELDKPFEAGEQRVAPLLFFSSLGGTTQAAAEAFVSNINSWRKHLSADEADNFVEAKCHDLSYIEYDDFFISAPKDQNLAYLYLFLLPTYNIDTTLDTFLEHLQETHNDFRIDTAPLSSILGYSVFGFGDKQDWPTEEEGFCSQAREVDKWMAKITGRKRAFPLGMGDVRTDSKERLEEWTEGIKEAMSDIMSGKGLGEGVAGSGDAVESDEEDADAEENTKTKLDDVEDLGSSYRNGTGAESGPLAIDFTTYSKSTKTVEPPVLKEMVPTSSPTYTALTKQGYTIVGSHSGVKICRWTKSALRGRGSCYKYSFYGIQSHLCMETTPSLSCSNKCVFCWRHGTNPVGTTWRWKVDPPEEIFEGVKAGHYKKIKMMKGVPGVRAERFQEAMRIKHCALSLVGEPIFYPHINEFTAMLHKERISSFLVCNAQHPDQLAALGHVTQLYVSIDASNKESLRKIDRPLHRDFWERFQRCLDILREKRFMQRTVFRLTLVKGFNIDDEVEGYADLVAQGLPCFVEVKGVTFCGTSTSSSAGLSMSNVPFYSEISEFVIALNASLEKRGLGYGIAAEHAHSCCVLLASNRFKIDGKWHTRIDYEKFFECLESGEEFGPDDYIGDETPEWALWGNGGFDPRDERVDRKGRPKVIIGDGTPQKNLIEI
ncbi:tRNA wybutosine-synthesizing protein 1 [Tothia fuscella]|uniref:S-adenosyl-L-methionine-dependent tRNA 4-demethylwyosine synthase n=1 Tax=Tothia fuscella TaxID=1048955 RepID=A0A9P4NWH8_9PEZI|nr:tRNA wybutosine-synthesizing protein 1 [Tothia fuscella]